MYELKLCPFCGGEGEMHACGELENETMRVIYSGKIGIHCTKCGISTLPYSDAKTAADIWNRRYGDE